MLMDEPFGAVDPIVRARLQEQFLDIQRRLRKTIVFVTHDIDEAIKMADRVAILNKGGVLEQFGTPEEVLREPASEFVVRFVGGDRSLKRLALIPVSRLELQAGPAVERSSRTSDALDVMDRAGSRWAAVVDGGRPLGWIERASLDGAATVAEARWQPLGARVTPESSLRDALDAIVGSGIEAAAVVDRSGDLVGTLSLERISEELAGMRGGHG